VSRAIRSAQTQVEQQNFEIRKNVLKYDDVLNRQRTVIYDERERTLGPEVMRELERRVVLSVLDRKWREHLYEMDYLQEGIGLRAMAQRDPLVEYQREGFQLFTAMNEAIKEESVGYVFNLEVEIEPAAPEPEEALEEHPHIVAKGLQAPTRPAQLQYTAPSVDGEAGVEVRGESGDGSTASGNGSGAGAGNGSGGSRAERRDAARAAKKARRR